MSLIKAKGVLSGILETAVLNGRIQRKNQDPLLPSDLVVADDSTVVVLSEQSDGGLAISEFCRCNGGTNLGNQIRAELNKVGLPVKD